jgi:hypothetical protein
VPRRGESGNDILTFRVDDLVDTTSSMSIAFPRSWA